MSGAVLDHPEYQSILRGALKAVAYGAEQTDDNKVEINFTFNDVRMNLTCGPAWASLDTAPRHEKLFLCREKGSNNVWEAMFFRESESPEMPEEYDVLQNMYLDEPVVDTDDLEWKAVSDA